MNLFNVVKKFVDEAYAKKGKSSIHFEETVKWIKKLKPNANNALLIAGYAHDIERAVLKDTVPMKSYQEGLSLIDNNYLEKHQKDSAKVISSFLKNQQTSKDLVERVFYLVSHHEIGGDEDANTLKDADSLSYFEVNAERHVKWVHMNITKEQIREKMDWMYNRITLKEAKDLCKPLYERGLKLLEDECR